MAGQNIYWVEAMTAYRPPAFRLLLSRREISSSLIHPYDPETDDGPLRLKDGRYFRNWNYTSEFMVEDDLLLERCIGLDFVMHHEKYCQAFGVECQDRKRQPSVHLSGSKILAFVLGHELNILDHHLSPPGADPLFTPLETAYSGLQEFLAGGVTFRGPVLSEAESQATVRGSLALYGMDQTHQARELLSMISSEVIFEKALIEIVRGPSWEPAPF